MFGLSSRLTGRLTLIVFVSVSVLGQGLHYLCGPEHSCSLVHAHGHSSHVSKRGHVQGHLDHAHCFQGHSHRQDQVSRPVCVAPGEQSAAGDMISSFDDDCEVCRLLSQSLLTNLSIIQSYRSDLREILNDASQFRMMPPALRRNSARAPPVAS